MATHTHPQGTKWYYSTDGVSYTEFTDVFSVMPPPVERGHSDDTVLSDTFEETTVGWKKATDGEFTLYLTKAILVTMLAAWAAGTIYYWRLTYPLIDAETTNSKWEWQGYIFKVETSAQEAMSEDKVKVTFGVRRTTIPVFTAGT